MLRIGIQIGSAVETSHRHGVLHRDIKPQNILTDSYGEPALTDFGIATTKGGDGPEGLSVPWSPPEILYGTAPGDQRSDVYSLGATLWHLLVGRSPFEEPGGDNGTFALMRRIKSDPPPRTQRADVPDSLERLLRQAMAKDPAARPQSAMELIRGLQSVEQELRLPLTQPILPADEPSGDTRGGDTIVRARARGGDTLGPGRGTGPAPRPAARLGPGDQPPWDAGRTRVRTAPGRPAAGRLDRRRRRRGDQRARRGPVRLDPWGTGGPAAGRSDRARAPMRLDPRGGATAGAARRLPRARVDRRRARPWEFAPETQDAATYARPTMLRPNGPVTPGGTAPASRPSAGQRVRRRVPGRARGQSGAGGQFGTGSEFGTGSRRHGPSSARTPRSARTPVRHGAARRGHRGAATARPGRLLALAAGGTVLVVAVGAYLTLGRGHGRPAPHRPDPARPPPRAARRTRSAPARGARPAGGDGDQRASATQIRFRWTYANPAAGDSFRWRRVARLRGQPRRAVTAKPRTARQVSAGQAHLHRGPGRRANGQASDRSQRRSAGPTRSAVSL